MVAVITAGDPTAPDRLDAFGWAVYSAADDTLDAVLAARAQAERDNHRHTVAVCSGPAANMGVALATEGRVAAVVSIGRVADFDPESLDRIRSPWLVIGAARDAAVLEPLARALEKGDGTGAVVQVLQDTPSLAAPDVRARAVTWIEHWAG